MILSGKNRALVLELYSSFEEFCTTGGFTRKIRAL